MRTLLAVLVSLGIAACDPGSGSPGDEVGSSTPIASESAHEFDDPEVTRVHRMMMDTLAPGSAWEDARYIRFDWVVDRGSGEPSRRFHRWDRWEGEYRLEWPVEGGTAVALFDVDDPGAGRVWVDGAPVEGARADSLLQGAHGAFINDTYWLLMPYKWTDPGVRAEYEGRRSDGIDAEGSDADADSGGDGGPAGEGGESDTAAADGSAEWEVVRLTFDSVGLTPQNQYLAFVNPETGIMERWHHFRSEGADPLVADWAGWERVGPILLASRRPIAGSPAEIRFENLEVSREVPEGAFQPPSANEEPSGEAEGGEADTGGP